jgi:hypothetical protein
MKDTLDGYSLGEQMRNDQEAADHQMIDAAIGRFDKGIEAAKDTVTDTLKRGENMLKRARNSTEGYLEDAIHEVRHNPVSAVALAFAGGVFSAGILALVWNLTKGPAKSSSVDESVE